MDVPIPSSITPDHHTAMALALSLATQSPRLPTNFRVGALVVHTLTGRVVASGYTLELPGNTHAEECCLLKLALALVRPTTDTDAEGDVRTPDELLVGKLPDVLTEPHTLYTTVEPCVRRLSGRMPCVERVLAQRSWLRTVCYGFKEPDTFVSGNEGLEMLRREGVEVVHVGGLEEEIRRVAMEGHVGGG